MKKSNKLIVLCVILVIIVLAIGYALFSERINITGTATAKGSMDLAITNINIIHGTGDLAWGEGDASYKIDGTKVKVEATLLKPGDFYSIQGTLQNNGTVDARFNGITATPQFNRNDACGLNSALDMCSTPNLKVYYDEDTGVYFLALLMDNKTGSINSNDIVVPAGTQNQDYPIGLIIGWDENWNQEITESLTVEFTADFGFIQNN